MRWLKAVCESRMQGRIAITQSTTLTPSVRTFQIRVPGRQCNDLRAITEIAGTDTGYLSEPLTKPSVTVRYRM